jgi:PadR family transcriptional regulator, regulatory protein PadR
MTTLDSKLLTREILLGFWKVHILHHAAEHPIIGQWVLTELRRHGYDISPGTLYPLLKRLERNGWLRSETAVGEGKRRRRYYHLTKRGAAVLDVLRETVVELHHEVVEEAVSDAPRKPFRLAGTHDTQPPTARAKRARGTPRHPKR